MGIPLCITLASLAYQEGMSIIGQNTVWPKFIALTMSTKC
jgi:hypothetical protein